MTHFTSVDKLNIFRLPVAWQYLVNNDLGGTLDATNFGQYDQLVQACLGTGAHCIIDIHNYARWNGNIIGQPGGPTNDQFSSLWSQLATKYAADKNVIMGLMNEPHDSMHDHDVLDNRANKDDSAKYYRLGCILSSCRDSYSKCRSKFPDNPFTR